MRDIPGFEGLYAATSCGKIWSHRRQKFMKPCGEKGNYQILWLSKNGNGKCYYVHRLIAMTYLPNPNNLPEINHIDEHKDNNCLNNLEWCSKKYNLEYSKHRRCKPVYCIELEKEFHSIYEAAKEFGRHPSNLCSHLSDNTPKSFAGYHWRYANE